MFRNISGTLDDCTCNVRVGMYTSLIFINIDSKLWSFIENGGDVVEILSINQG